MDKKNIRRKRIKYFLPLLLLLAVLVGVFVYGYVNIRLSHLIYSPFSLEIKSQEQTETVHLWDNEKFTLYAFLPSYADLSDVHIRTESKHLVLGSTPINDGCSLSEIELGKTYFLHTRWKLTPVYRVIFLRSSNVPAMFISTESGNMDAVYADRTTKEGAVINVIDIDGTAAYKGNDKGTIKGRGKSTWLRYKKPFQINLGSASELLGMAPAKKWILLANAYDDTNLRNALVFHLAADTGMTWTPECRYVDLYLNGNYNGLYLLTEKIEVSDERLHLPDAGIDYLVEQTVDSKLNDGDVFFITDNGRCFELHYPENCSDEQLDAIRASVQSAEDSILNGTMDKIDVDSFIKVLLINTVSANEDSAASSNYFYHSPDTDLLYAGPVWDYDLTFGNTSRDWDAPEFLPDQEHYFSGLWFEKCYSTEAFYSRLSELYRTVFQPALHHIKDTGFQTLCDSIEQASSLDYIRWKRMFVYYDTSGIDRIGHIDSMRSWLFEHIDYLDASYLGASDSIAH